MRSQNDPKSMTKSRHGGKETTLSDSQRLEAIGIGKHLWSLVYTAHKTFIKQGVYGMASRRKPLLAKKIIAAHLKFVKVHNDAPQQY